MIYGLLRLRFRNPTNMRNPHYRATSLCLLGFQGPK